MRDPYIHVPINPVAKPRMTRRDKWDSRPVVVKYRRYCDNLRLLLSQHRYEMGDGLDVEFHIQMPDSWSKKKKREYIGKPHKQTPDIDNLIKGIMDACLKEDSHVYYVMASKFWAEKGEIIIYDEPLI